MFWKKKKKKKIEVKEVIKVTEKDKLIFLFDGYITSEQIDEFKAKINKFFKDKKQRFILVGGVKIEKITIK